MAFQTPGTGFRYNTWEKIDYQQLLWRHLDRLNESSKDQEEFDRNVVTLSNMTYPYWDKKIQKESDDLSEKKQTEIKSNQSEAIDQSWYYREMYKQLLLLLDRKGWLAEKEIIDGDIDDEDPD